MRLECREWQATEMTIAGYDRRDAIFGGDLFTDPSWHILLDLHARHPRRCTVSDLCIASRAPATTALRHLDKLERRGLIERQPDTNDGRRVWMALTEDGLAKMNALFSAQ